MSEREPQEPEFDEQPFAELDEFPDDDTPEFADPDDGESPSPPGFEEPAQVFASVEEFVARYLLPMYRRAVSGNDSTWCAEWWRHPEAIVRLDALWRAWEYLRLDPATGTSVWLRDHCDFHMRVLLSADGPFKGCTPDTHASRPVSALPCEAMPAELLARLRTASAGQMEGE
jgi:Domain of unknown function (DUF4913)